MGVHDDTDDTGHKDGGHGHDGSNDSVSDSLSTCGESTDLLCHLGEVGEDCVTEHEVAEESAPDAELASKYNLVNAVLAESDSIVEIEKPERDGHEADGNE